MTINTLCNNDSLDLLHGTQLRRYTMNIIVSQIQRRQFLQLLQRIFTHIDFRQFIITKTQYFQTRQIIDRIRYFKETVKYYRSFVI